MENKIIVYHGSDCVVTSPDLSKCKKGKDFGQGFYVTTDKEQAIKFAKIIATRNGKNKGVVNVYIFDTTQLNSVSKFDFLTTNAEWLNCIIGHRDNRFASLKKEWVDYDIITGKIADDDTSQVINAYLSGAYGPVGSKKAIAFAIKMFMPSKLKNQMCFRTLKAIALIKFVECFEVER